MKNSKWFEDAKLGDCCCWDERCQDCKPNGFCDTCDTMDGRWLEAVNCYASTCDGCSELTLHEMMVMDPITQLGYCQLCCEEYGLKWNR